MSGNKRNVVLIGMPGAGKSTVGVVLAKALGMGFCDTDLAVQAAAGRRLQEILDRDGIAAFLRLEEQVVASLALTDTVIATGGSTVYGAAAMKRLHETGVVIYLRVRCDTMARRVADYRARGIAMREGESLETLYGERAPLYEREADIVVDANTDNVEQLVAKIVAVIGK